MGVKKKLLLRLLELPATWKPSVLGRQYLKELISLSESMLFNSAKTSTISGPTKFRALVSRPDPRLPPTSEPPVPGPIEFKVVLAGYGSVQTCPIRDAFCVNDAMTQLQLNGCSY